MTSRIIIAIVLLCVTALVGCGLSPETEKVVKDSIAINASYSRDEALPQQARFIALDNHDLLWAILYNEGSVSEVPSDVQARKDARAAAAGAK